MRLLSAFDRLAPLLKVVLDRLQVLGRVEASFFQMVQETLGQRLASIRSPAAGEQGMVPGDDGRHGRAG